MTEAGFSIEGGLQEVDDFLKSIAGFVPNPTHYRVLELNKEYTPDEIKKELQKFSSYLSYLYAFLGRMNAEHIVVSKGLKKGMSIARLDSSLDQNLSLTDREAQVLANSPDFARYTKQDILSEAYVEILKGWCKSYEAAYIGASRMLSADEAEAQAISTRVP